MMRFKKKLALQLLEESFGDIVKDVADAILDTEICSLKNLQRTLLAKLSDDKRLSLKQVKHALLILLKHNCLKVELPSEVNIDLLIENKLEIQGMLYALDLENIFHRMRYGVLLSYVHEKYGEVAEKMMASLMQAGSQRQEELLAIIKTDYNNDEESIYDENEVLKIFDKLVLDRLIVLLPSLDPKIRELDTHTHASSTSRAITNILGTVGGGGGGIGGDGNTYSSSSAAATTQGGGRGSVRGGARGGGAGQVSGQGRGRGGGGRGGRGGRGSAQGSGSSTTEEVPPVSSLLPVELLFGVSASSQNPQHQLSNSLVQGGETEWLPPQSTDDGNKPAVKRKRLTKTTEVSSSSQGHSEGNTQLSSSSGSSSHHQGSSRWRVNVSAYLLQKNQHRCIDFVGEKFEQVSGQIIRTLALHQGGAYQGGSAQLGGVHNRSVPMSLTDLFTALQTTVPSFSAMNLDIHTLRRVLDILRTSSMKAVSKVVQPAGGVGGGGVLGVTECYVVHYDHILAALKKRTLHTLLSQRYNMASSRLFALLIAQRSYLEQQVIIDQSILPAREVRERLYALYRDGWINYIELNKNNNYAALAGTGTGGGGAGGGGGSNAVCYYWFIDQERLAKTISETYYHALCNLRMVITQQEEVLIQEMGGDLENKQSALLSLGSTLQSQTTQEDKKWQTVTQRLQVLMNSIRYVDEALQLFES